MRPFAGPAARSLRERLGYKNTASGAEGVTPAIDARRLLRKSAGSSTTSGENTRPSCDRQSSPSRRRRGRARSWEPERDARNEVRVSVDFVTRPRACDSLERSRAESLLFSDPPSDDDVDDVAAPRPSERKKRRRLRSHDGDESGELTAAVTRQSASRPSFESDSRASRRFSVLDGVSRPTATSTPPSQPRTTPTPPTSTSASGKTSASR
jgi:hypothetical protein